MQRESPSKELLPREAAKPVVYAVNDVPALLEYCFTVSLERLVAAVWDIEGTKFSKPLWTNPKARDKSLWCEFHGTHGHDTGTCLHLREAVAELLKVGHLQEFLSKQAKSNYRRDAEGGQTSTAAGTPRKIIG